MHICNEAQSVPNAGNNMWMMPINTQRWCESHAVYSTGRLLHGGRDGKETSVKCIVSCHVLEPNPRVGE